ncbi:MAG: penicillin-binding transpeptidase domain-containing protein [Defluviitaleaceae bacterium]|nr:penicillin-binding transpeptidase domain-containing protein [Defluviitaleaceae bacterium]
MSRKDVRPIDTRRGPRRHDDIKRQERQDRVRAHRQKQAEIRTRRIYSQQWRGKKLNMMAVFFVCVLAFFLWEISRWQSFARDDYAIRTQTQILNHHSDGDRIVRPVRGSITDRNMQTLAVSSVVYNVFVDVRLLAQRSEAEIARNRQVLTEFFGMSSADFAAMMATNPAGELVNNVQYFVIERGLSHSRMLEYEQWLDQQRTDTNRFVIRDIHLEEYPRRSYIHNTLAAPVVGFFRGEWWGLERQFNEYLTGSVGRTMTTFDSHGMITTDRIPPTHGANIITTLDMNIQRYSEEVAAHFTRDFQAGMGAVIVMDPNTGEILTMAQYPSFDANAPGDLDRIVGEDVTARMRELESDSPEFLDYLFGVWRNFNVSTPFEPGSTYKSILVAKALEEGIIYPAQTFYCPGFKYVAGFRIHCARRSGHGRLNLTQALAVSCNVAHMDIAEAVGRNIFWQYQRDFGYGVLTGIDLPGESPGEVFPVHGLNAAEIATSAFGQRFTSTSLQAITSFAALINGGHMLRPYFVSQIIDDRGNILYNGGPQVERQVISRETSDWVRRAMEYTVTEGTARNAVIEGYSQGGKTATAEQGVPGTPGFTGWTLSYIGFFPLENPQYLIMTVIHDVPNEVYQARAGNRSAVPMFREIAQEIIRLRGLAPTTATEAPGTAHTSDFIEDFVGLTVQSAVARLNQLGINHEFVGAGGNIISSQFPTAGSRSTGSVTIMLNTTNDGTATLHEVPDVIGQPVTFAREILSAAGFAPRIVYDTLPDYTESTDEVDSIVIDQSARGTRLPAGTEILLRTQLQLP